MDSHYCYYSLLGHLTSFALLLSGRQSNDPCASDNENYLFSWISLGFIAGAILFTLCAVIALEVRVQMRRRHRAQVVSLISSRRQGRDLNE